MNYRMVGILLGICAMLVVTIGVIVPPATAYPYVIQGQTINQTETYDMRSIYGFSGQLGWWKHWYEEGDDNIEPDKIIDLNDMGGVKQYAVYIDPEIWNTGNWYQWDGIGKSRNGNTFVFRVNRSQTTLNSTAVVNNSSGVVSVPKIRVTTNKTATPTPVKTQGTIVLQSTPAPKATAKILNIATPAGAKGVGIPFLPSSPFIAVIALCGVGLFLLRR